MVAGGVPPLGRLCTTPPPGSVRFALTRTGPPAYFQSMFSTLLVIGGVLVGLLVLLALIVSLSAPPTPRRGTTTAGRADSWVADAGRPHPDMWSAPSNTSTEIRAIR